MLKIVEAVKQAVAALAATFAGGLAALPVLADALKIDLTAGKAAALAALAAGFATVFGFAGNLAKQAIQRARGLLDVSYEELAGLLDEAEGAIRAAKNAL